jgi:hypothetical protein
MKKILYYIIVLLLLSTSSFSQDSTKTSKNSASKKKSSPYTWNDFLAKNIDMEVASRNGAPVGQYTVVIQFTIETDGTLGEFVPLTNFGYGMEDEVIRVLKKSPLWTPAIQNGQPVKAIRKQPITFVVEEQ